MASGAAADVAALVLAAEPGTGFEPNVALARWGDQTVVEHVAGVVADVIDTVVVVVGAAGDDVVDATDLGAASIVIDPEWEEGPASPVRVGLDTISRLPEIETVVIVEAHFALIDPSVLVRLLESHRIEKGLATVPKYRYQWSSPFVIDRDLWPRLMGMEGDATILTLLQAHKHWVKEVWIDQLPPASILTPDDLAEVAPRP